MSVFVYARLPRLVDRASTTVADQLADGAWLAAVPGLALVIPVVAFLVGFLAPYGVLGGEIELVMSESLLLLLIAIATAFASGSAGIAFWLGYVAANALGPMLDIASHWEFERRAGLIGGLLVTDLLFGVLLILVPNLARRMAEEIDLPFRADQAGDRALLRARTLLYAGSAGLLVTLWSQATIVLIRPPWVWSNQGPRLEAVYNVQENWLFLVATAMAVAALRIVLEQAAVARPRWADRVHALLDRRWLPPLHRVRSSSPGAILGRAMVLALLTTALLGGLYEAVVDAAVVFVAALATLVWRSGAFVRAPRRYVEAMNQIPSVVRLAIAVTVAYLLGQVALAGLYQDGTFRSVLVGAVVTLLLLAALFPARVRAGGEAGARAAS